MKGRELLVRVADLRAGVAGDLLVTVGLGSCGAILLYDEKARVGGLAHVLLPSPALTRSDANPARIPQSAVPRLLQLMAAEGARQERVTARLAGGASMFNTRPP